MAGWFVGLIVGVVLGAYGTFAAFTLGVWRRRGGSTRFMGRPVPGSWWAWLLMLLWLTLFLPVAVLHDALFEKRWVAFFDEAPRPEPELLGGVVQMSGPEGELGTVLVSAPFVAEGEHEGAVFCHVEFVGGGPFDGKEVDVPVPPAVAGFALNEWEIAPADGEA